MGKFINRSSAKAGASPGTLMHVGTKKAHKVRVLVTKYDEKNFLEKETEDADTVSQFTSLPGVSWIHIDGVHETNLIQTVGTMLNIHPLTLEDIVNTGQRPKLEDFDHYLFIVVKLLSQEPSTGEIQAEQISILLGKDYVVSFQEKPGHVFDSVRERIRTSKGKIRKVGPDYLAYALLDSVVDSYFLILENVGERTEDIEQELLEDPTPETRQKIYNLKREMIFVRKSVWPLRDVVMGYDRGQSSLVRDSTHIYLKDLYDHTLRVIDTVETFREITSGMLDSYLSSISNKMNEVMKVLTIFAAIFIPLTFIAGIYGMNFEFMPELHHQWGYAAWWGVIILVATVMLIFFKHKKWL